MNRQHGRDVHADSRAHFMTTMGFEWRIGEHSAAGRVTMGPYLQSGPNWPGAAALLTFADVLIGQLAAARTHPRISVTADLGVRVLAPLPRDGIYEITAELLKSGRTMTFGEARFRSADGELVASSTGTFLASPRPVDEAPDGFPDSFSTQSPESVAPTLAEQVGLELVAPGHARVALRPDLLNATESLQGGLVALLTEVAAASAATERAGRTRVVHALQVHYLAAARVGPFYTSAEINDRDGSSLVRVEVRDPGRDDRLVCLALADTCAPQGPDPS